jgi:hypothetical protein
VSERAHPPCRTEAPRSLCASRNPRPLRGGHNSNLNLSSNCLPITNPRPPHSPPPHTPDHPTSQAAAHLLVTAEGPAESSARKLE